jgi:ubiquinone/menaquinone biosynthesis C-methylase UbiE
MRTYTKIDQYLDSLLLQIYAQPEDAGHTKWARESIDFFAESCTHPVASVLDAGCGEGFCQPMFEEKGIAYTGVALRDDVESAVAKGRNVLSMDFSFLDFPDGSFHMVFSRHSLEHSPMPLLTLMEWKRVSAKYVALVLPNRRYLTPTSADASSSAGRILAAPVGSRSITSGRFPTP